jgi:hypothetical protein
VLDSDFMEFHTRIYPLEAPPEGTRFPGEKVKRNPTKDRLHRDVMANTQRKISHLGARSGLEFACVNRTAGRSLRFCLKFLTCRRITPSDLNAP